MYLNKILLRSLSVISSSQVKLLRTRDFGCPAEKKGPSKSGKSATQIDISLTFFEVIAMYLSITANSYQQKYISNRIGVPSKNKKSSTAFSMWTLEKNKLNFKIEKNRKTENENRKKKS